MVRLPPLPEATSVSVPRPVLALGAVRLPVSEASVRGLAPFESECPAVTWPLASTVIAPTVPVGIAAESAPSAPKSKITAASRHQVGRRLLLQRSGTGLIAPAVDELHAPVEQRCGHCVIENR